MRVCFCAIFDSNKRVLELLRNPKLVKMQTHLSFTKTSLSATLYHNYYHQYETLMLFETLFTKCHHPLGMKSASPASSWTS